MKIATKLKLGAVVPALMALIIGFALIFSYRTVQEAQKNDRTVQRIITGMNELSSLVSEYTMTVSGQSDMIPLMPRAMARE